MSPGWRLSDSPLPPKSTTKLAPAKCLCPCIQIRKLIHGLYYQHSDARTGRVAPPEHPSRPLATFPQNRLPATKLTSVRLGKADRRTTPNMLAIAYHLQCRDTLIGIAGACNSSPWRRNATSISRANQSMDFSAKNKTAKPVGLCVAGWLVMTLLVGLSHMLQRDGMHIRAEFLPDAIGGGFVAVALGLINGLLAAIILPQELKYGLGRRLLTHLVVSMMLVSPIVLIDVARDAARKSPSIPMGVRIIDEFEFPIFQRFREGCSCRGRVGANKSKGTRRVDGGNRGILSLTTARRF